jgi:hypothetical protein
LVKCRSADFVVFFSHFEFNDDGVDEEIIKAFKSIAWCRNKSAYVYCPVEQGTPPTPLMHRILGEIDPGWEKNKLVTLSQAASTGRQGQEV